MRRPRSALRIQTTDSLFPWERLEDIPGLATCQRFMELLPDAGLLAALRTCRGRGRNDYPVGILWRVHLLRYLLRHPTMEACLAELGRNAALRKLAGIEDGRKVPEAWNMSRFAAVLGRPEASRLAGGDVASSIARLAAAVPDLGVRLAGDSAALAVRGDADPAPVELPQPDGGRKEYTDEAGRSGQGLRVVRLQVPPAGGRRARGGPGLPDDAGQRRRCDGDSRPAEAGPGGAAPERRRFRADPDPGL